MKRAVLLVLVLMSGVNCASRITSQSNNSATQNAQPNAQPTESVKPSAAEGDEVASTEKVNEVPPEFRDVDFKNFVYPASYGKGSVRLKDGSYEQAEGMGGDTFELRDISFVDLAGDEKKEAVVELFWLSCGGSCDGGSHLFYVYSSRQNRPALFWRIESGSTAYGCGFKSLKVNGRKINLELFNNCRFNGATPENTPAEGESGKFSALVYTHFLFESNGKKMALKRREVFPYPEGSAKNYRPEVKISND
jgi:hypothetical protein